MHVGYLLTDIEGSTERWESSPARMAAAVARHDEIVDAAVAEHGGVIQDRAGDGVFAAFDTGSPIACALAIQRAVAGADWSDIGGLKVRIGIHVGAPTGATLIDRAAVNRASRICSAAWGGQIVVSAAAAAAYPLPDGATLADLGICYLKGIPEALHLLGVTHPDLPDANFPPLRSQFRTEGTIPVQATPIFGRAEDIVAISAALSTTRLLTVVAPGGNGKTRLAIELGKQWERETPVLFVSLRGVVGSSALASAIGEALRFPFRERSSQEAQLIAYFSDKRLLLILDNAEGLVGDADFVAKLASSCPELSLLLTSREPLRISGEGLYRLGGVSNFDRTGGLDPALQLFLHAARLREPDFDLSVEQIPTFQALCTRVSGSPLALRLMAQWVSFLSLEEILARVHADLDFLDGTSNGEGHHRTLREVFEESWRRLEDSQRSSLAAMSVFEGPFDWKTANAALDTPLEAFAALEQRGLIEPAFGRRFSMHPLVRSYAREKLESDPSLADEVIVAHRAYFLGLLCSRMSAMATLGQARVIDELQMEFADIKAAWFNALEAGDSISDQAVEHLAYFMNLRSMLREAVGLFDESKATNPSTAEHSRALRGCFFVMQGDSGRAQSYSEAVLNSDAAPKLATAHAHMALANLAHAGGAFKTACGHYETVLRIRRAENDKIGDAFVTIALAGLHIAFGDPAIARELIKEGFVISREIGLTFGLVMCHLFAGELALNEDRLEDAHVNFVSGLELERSANTPQYRAQLLRRLGALDRRMGKYAEAEKYHAEALELLLDLGDQRAQAQAYIELGEVSLAVENFGEARDRFLRGVRLGAAFASDHLKNLALLGLARTEMSLGNVENAERIAAILADTEVAQKEPAYMALIDAIGPQPSESPPCDLDDVLSEIANDADARALML